MRNVGYSLKASIISLANRRFKKFVAITVMVVSQGAYIS